MINQAIVMMGSAVMSSLLTGGDSPQSAREPGDRSIWARFAARRLRPVTLRRRPPRMRSRSTRTGADCHLRSSCRREVGQHRRQPIQYASVGDAVTQEVGRPGRRLPAARGPAGGGAGPASPDSPGSTSRHMTQRMGALGWIDARRRARAVLVRASIWLIARLTRTGEQRPCGRPFELAVRFAARCRAACVRRDR